MTEIARLLDTIVVKQQETALIYIATTILLILHKDILH